MRMTWIAMCVAAGCSTNAVKSGDMGVNAPTDMALAPGALTVQAPAFDVQSGQEITNCVTVKLPSTMDADYVNISSTLAPGSHHLIVYKSNATAENLTPTPCVSFSGVLGGLTPIYIAQTEQTRLTMPAGVAYHFPAGQMFQIEAHYINATLNDLKASGSVTFSPAPAGGTFQAADIMFCGSVKQLGGLKAITKGCPPDGGLPPGEATTLNPGFYAGGGDVDFTKLKIFGFTGHEHHYGTDVKLWKATSAQPNSSPPLYESTSWNNAPLEIFSDNNLVTFNPGEGIEWQCSYDTAGATTDTCFGESAATNEMCFFWAYYFPSVGRFIQEQDCWQ